MAFTAIPNSSIDADSPLDSTLFTYLRDNDDYLKARFHITTGHNHGGGTDSGAPVSTSIASFGTLIISSNSLVGANAEISVNLGGTTQAHKFYLISAYTNAGATKVVYGASVSFAEAVNADIHVFISRDSADAQERLKIVNGTAADATVFYKVYGLTE